MASSLKQSLTALLGITESLTKYSLHYHLILWLIKWTVFTVNKPILKQSYPTWKSSLKARKRIVNYIYHHTDSLISKTRNKKNARPQKLSVQGREGCLTLPNIWLIGKIAVDIKLVGKLQHTMNTTRSWSARKAVIVGKFGWRNSSLLAYWGWYPRKISLIYAPVTVVWKTSLLRDT